MVFRYFNTGLWLRLLIINILAVAAGFLFFAKGYVYTPAFLLGTQLIFAIELTYYLRNTQRKISRFFESASHQDFSFTFTKNVQNPDVKELHEALNNVAERYRAKKLIAEENIKFNETIIDQIPLGILIFDSQNQLTRYNNHARKILGDNTTTHVQKLLEKYNFLPDLPGYSSSPAPFITELAKEDTTVKIALHEQRFVHNKQHFKILTLQNFSETLDKNELQSWQNIIRVLTHEIMNSLTPVVSLSETALQLADKQGQEETVKQSLEIVQRRSQGLLGFVHSYRKITNIKPLQKTVFKVSELLSSIAILKSGELKELDIKLTAETIPDDIELEADYELLEQVIINLINNAKDAVINIPNAYIKVIAEYDYLNKVKISVNDNGDGISTDVLDKIFIPFFTTKKSGTGIGLSLSKQIAIMHGGSLYFENHSNGNTQVVVKF